MAERLYHRLPGRSRQFLNSSTLWEASDHLLQVQSHVVSESYRRFFFRDIQAVIICETKSGRAMTIVLAGLGAILCLPMPFVPMAGIIAFGSVAALFFLLALINFLRGPTCVCTLRTAVQTQELASLTRLKTARKVLGQLQPKIAAAQAEANSAS
jgi:hypothetical protein